MKFVWTKRRKWMVAGAGLFLATATPSFALFGIGDIVFDPTSYASLVSQLSQMTTQYNMLKTNLQHFSLKSQWQNTLKSMEHVNVANQFGETNGLTAALNTNSPSAASTAWGSATVPVNNGATTYLASQSTNGAAQSQLAMGRSLRCDLARLPQRSGCIPCGPRCKPVFTAKPPERSA